MSTWPRDDEMDSWPLDNVESDRPLPSRGIQLEEEGGVTSVSLANAAKLIAAYGKPVQVVLEDNPEDGHIVTAFWPGDRSFKFTGFSWGYGGTGPHGLERFFEMAGIVCGIKSIMSWPEKGLKKTI